MRYEATINGKEILPGRDYCETCRKIIRYCICQPKSREEVLAARIRELEEIAERMAQRLDTANRCAHGDHYDERISEAVLTEYAAYRQKHGGK